MAAAESKSPSPLAAVGLIDRTADLPPYHYGASFRKEEGMSNQLPVDQLALREEVKAKYRAVAVDPHGSYHFSHRAPAGAPARV